MIFGKHFVMVIPMMTTAFGDTRWSVFPLCPWLVGPLVTLLTCLKGDLGSKPCSVFSMQFR